MNLERLIIHEIIKVDDAAGGRVHIEYSDRPALNDTQAVRFVTELNKRYRNLRQSSGQFQSTVNDFPNHFQAYHAGGSEEEFINFSRNTMPTLQAAVAATAAKGGYVVFADYTDVHRFIGVFLIRNRQGSSVQKGTRDTTFVINETVHIDFEHLAMACRINKNRYTLNSGGYLTFINSRNIDSQFFINWIRAEELINNTEDTRKLLKILKEIDPPLDGNGRPFAQTDFLNDVYRFIKESPRGAETDLKAIGQRFYEDENKLTSYAEEHDITLNHQFKPDGSILRQFVNIKVKADHIDLVFPQTFLDERKIEVYPNEGKIVINSRELIAAIQTERNISNG
ncbi:MAG TPA: nucleoid-associated protein [Puia sp.]|nr:nucleoid-associated protein [Puia sp.]